MSRSSELLLVGTSGPADPGAALRSLLAREAPEFGFLYTAEDAACLALAERIGDSVWLTPRRYLGLCIPRAWLELLRSHRYARVIAVVPAPALELPPEVLFDVLRGARCTRWSDAAAPVLTLSMPAARD